MGLRALWLVLLCAATVVVTDLVMQSSLLRLFLPRIVTPADGAITSGPVVVAWEGPEPMRATLTGSSLRVDLGLRESPFEIDAGRFPRSGQYGIELRSAWLGGLVFADRRFMVERAGDTAPTAETEPPPAAGDDERLAAAVGQLQAERDRLRGELAQVHKFIADLQQQNSDLNDTLDELQADGDARLAVVEAQRQELAREHMLALQDNQALRLRLESLPACVAWGYLHLPRPQTSPPSRRVVVSDRNGNVFRSEFDCARARQSDPSSASPCGCVGSVWGAELGP